MHNAAMKIHVESFYRSITFSLSSLSPFIEETLLIVHYK